MAEPITDRNERRGERLGCGVLALLMLLAFAFGLLGGAAAGVGVTLALRLVPVAQPTAVQPTSVPCPTPLPALPTSVPASAPLPATTGEEPAVVLAVRRVGPAVVTVINQLPPRRTFGRITQPEARGSGVIIDDEGHIVTNNHVIEGAQALSVILSSGERRDAKLIGADVFSDLAVIQIDAAGLPRADLGDSSALEVGQAVVAIGSALGDFRNTVTVGVVSGLGRSLDTENDFKLEDLIQTDAAINQGNSGGPLIDLQGRIVGINTAIVGRSSSGVVAEGLGFAISVNTVRDVAAQLIATGKVARPSLGIGYEPMTPQMASYYGLSVSTGILVTDVPSGSAAAQAGLQPGDVIVRIEDNDIDDSNPFLNVLMRFKPGDKVKLLVNRYGQSLTISATLGQR